MLEAMRIFRCYAPLGDSIDFNRVYQLSPRASKHLGQVLRVKSGDALELFDGFGKLYRAEVIEVGKLIHVRLQRALESDKNESPLHLALISAVGKGEKMDWIVQKATELGVSAIYPVVTARCEVRLNSERWQKKIERWQEIAMNACEQSQRTVLPTVHDIADLSSRLQLNDFRLKLLLHPELENPSLKTLLATTKLEQPKRIALLIGPEGGFDVTEVRLANEQGFMGISCGPRILRMETAALASLAILQMMYGDL